jgi:hypothetical protein
MVRIIQGGGSLSNQDIQDMGLNRTVLDGKKIKDDHKLL